MRVPIASLEQVPTIDEPELFVLVDGRVLVFCDFVKYQDNKEHNARVLYRS
jgi:hypothetical protein